MPQKCSKSLQYYKIKECNKKYVIDFIDNNLCLNISWGPRDLPKKISDMCNQATGQYKCLFHPAQIKKVVALTLFVCKHSLQNENNSLAAAVLCMDMLKNMTTHSSSPSSLVWLAFPRTAQGYVDRTNQMGGREENPCYPHMHAFTSHACNVCMSGSGMCIDFLQINVVFSGREL